MIRNAPELGRSCVQTQPLLGHLFAWDCETKGTRQDPFPRGLAPGPGNRLVKSKSRRRNFGRMRRPTSTSRLPLGLPPGRASGRT